MAKQYINLKFTAGFAAGLLILFFGCSNFVLAQESSSELFCEPRIIDVETEDREIIETSIKLVNGLDRRVELTPLVLDYYSTADYQDNSANVKTFAYWIVLHRGAVVLASGEEREYPLKIDIPKYAQEGTYYAYVIYSEGKNLSDPASISSPLSSLATLVRLNLKKKKIETAELAGLKSKQNIFLSNPVVLNYAVRNIGTENIDLDGFLRIYNRRGEEIENFAISEKSVSQGEERGSEVTWSPDFGFGKYQAKLIFQYGTESRRDLADTIYFWVLPWQLLAAFIVFVIFIFVLFLYLILRKSGPKTIITEKNQ